MTKPTVDPKSAVATARSRLAWRRNLLWFFGAGIGFIIAGVLVYVIAGLLAVGTANWPHVVGGTMFGLAFLSLIGGFVAYIVNGLMIRSAVKKLPTDAADLEPLQPGERFGNMRVLVADAEKVHMALPVPAYLAGGVRLLAALACLVIGAGLVYVVLTSTQTNGRGIVAGVLIAAAAGPLLYLPVAVQWIAGELGAGGRGERGIVIERVRWFVVHEAYELKASDIEGLVVDGMWLKLRGRDGQVTPLVRAGGADILGAWDKRRIAAAISRALRRRIDVQEKKK